MDEILTINTDKNSIEKVVIEPLQVFTEGFESLKKDVPEYAGNFDKTIVEIAERMKTTLKMYNGLGLSANQCGLDLRMFVMGTEGFIITCVNPRIISSSESLVGEKEGCLSFPGLFLNKKRNATIDVEYWNEFGEHKLVQFSGLTARIFQHELEHLNGIQFIDNVGKTALMFARNKQKKLIKKFSRIVARKYTEKT